MGNQTGPPHSDLNVLIRRSAAKVWRSAARCSSPMLLPTATPTTSSTAAKVPPRAGSANDLRRRKWGKSARTDDRRIHVPSLMMCHKCATRSLLRDGSGRQEVDRKPLSCRNTSGAAGA